MTNAKFLGSALLAALLCGALLFAAGPIAAYPGWSKSEGAGPDLTAEQRDQIRNLKAAYRSAVENLDWSVDENGHAPETMRQVRELRIALHAEIMDVLGRKRVGKGAASEGACPYSGEAQPVRFESNADTLYL